MMPGLAELKERVFCKIFPQNSASAGCQFNHFPGGTLRMKTCQSLIFAIFILCAFAAFAQPRSSADTVSVDHRLSLEQVVAGEEFKIAIILDIEEGWHINAHQPIQDYLIGTELKLGFQDHFFLADIVYPQPREYEFSFAKGEVLLVYEGTEHIFMTLRTSSSLDPGHYLLSGTLSVQACDDNTCLAPSIREVEIPLEVISAGSEPAHINEDFFAAYEPGSRLEIGAAVRSRSAHEFGAIFDAGMGLWVLAAIFLIGLALNLTPCVYPMLSVTVSVFGAQTDTRTGAVLARAVIYVLGIATMYSILGVMAAFSGRLFGFWLQSPIVLALIGMLMLLLALSMFGLYNLQVPYWLTSRLGSGNFGDFLGTYISGMVVGIFAAPCIGPPIIALIAFVGSRGDPLLGFWIFFILALGLGFPYLILGTFTGLIQKLPKSGDWMTWVKKVFGVVLMGLGFFYIALAFFPGFVMHIIILTLLAGGVYLGFLERTGTRQFAFRWVKAAAGTALVAAGIMVFFNLHKEAVEWDDYSRERLEYASENNIPAIIDFYADWCIPCLELERNTFTDPRVIEATRPMIRLKVDMTHFDSPESRELRKKFEVIGVPTIIFLDQAGQEVWEARIVGFMNADNFLKNLELAITNRL
jgi:thioredoxin:protein disulfide reductase